ncbi:MAG TPA: metallophosphoesterase [Syntrophobacteraceae bacterium]|nr:metallophosphoesterase [Syntrophobacteraceae bacterium]
MGDKRVFISDIHMGCDESVAPRKPYVWFKDNAGLLAQFLDEQLEDAQVKEVIILGDLFDEWVIPTDYQSITSFDRICSNSTNKDVVAGLEALAGKDKLVYVPGNHDMAITVAGIDEIKNFMENKTFPGIRFICDGDEPLGKYQDEDKILVAEHGNRYCLFNAPDTWTDPRLSFLPLGYFISRMVAYKVSTTGHQQEACSIFFDFLREILKGNQDFEEELFEAIADDCMLKPTSTIQLDGIPGCGAGMMVSDIGKRFRQLFSNWGRVPGADYVSASEAVVGEIGDLYEAAASTYFRPESSCKVVIFGHTHEPSMRNTYKSTSPDFVVDEDTACETIYANSGTWVDYAGKCGNYVETEIDGNRLYVRVKEYPGKNVIKGYAGFIEKT